MISCRYGQDRSWVQRTRFDPSVYFRKNEEKCWYGDGEKDRERKREREERLVEDGAIGGSCWRVRKGTTIRDEVDVGHQPATRVHLLIVIFFSLPLFSVCVCVCVCLMFGS